MTDGPSTVLRLYLVRHGETEANVQGIVVGNAESPLTAWGIEQAKALGRQSSSWLCDDRQLRFHRIWSSDLDRAKHTAALTLGELALVMPRSNDGRAVSVAPSVAAAETAEAADGDDAGASWPFSDWPRSVLDTPDLRELAKGPRQGFPKHMSLDQSKERRRQLAMAEPFPPLETEDDGWKRMSRWLGRQIRAAIDETVAATTTTTTTTMMKMPADEATTFHVLAFGHSGIFRVFLTRLIGQQVLLTHPDVKLDNQGRFSVPNASLTILDIHLDPSNPVVDGEKPENRIRKVDVVVLTSTEHYLVQPQPPQTF